MHIAGIFDDIDDSYWAHETLVREILDEHAPQKQNYPKNEATHFMNSEPRRAIYKKDCLAIFLTLLNLKIQITLSNTKVLPNLLELIQSLTVGNHSDMRPPTAGTVS